MTRALTIHTASPGVTVQDKGRTGFLAQGLSRGGAVDLLALAEGAALLGQPDTCAVLGTGGRCGRAECVAGYARGFDRGQICAPRWTGTPLVWGASHALPQGVRLEISPSRGGFGYLHVGGGLEPADILGTASAHLAAGIGRAVQAGDTIAVGRRPWPPHWDVPAKRGHGHDPASCSKPANRAVWAGCA